MKKLTWSTASRRINDLVPYEKNPRKMSEIEVQHLKNSLEKFDLVEIPAIDVDNKIVAGHQRLKVLQLLGRGEEMIDVRIPSRKLTEEEFKEYLLRSNRNHGDFDWDQLANSFDIEQLLGVGFSKDELGFFSLEEDDFDAEAEANQITTPVSKLGDVYQLGRHRLMCGDSAKEEDLNTLMDGKKARLIFTDPPYNVNYKSSSGRSYSSVDFGGSGGKIFNDDKSDDDCLKFYTDVLVNLYKHSTDDVTLYWWFASKNNWINRFALKNAGWYFSQEIMWLKNSMIFSMGQTYHRMFEPCMLAWKQGKSHFINKTINNYTDVINLEVEDFSNLLDVWYEKRDNTNDYVHPTQKPVRLAERALKRTSQIGDVVLDVFGGSGSTLISCEQSERTAYVMEMDPKFVDVIVKRWESFTNQQAVKL